ARARHPPLFPSKKRERNMLRSTLLFFAFPLIAALVACDCGGSPPVEEGDAGLKCSPTELLCVVGGVEECVAYDLDALCEPWEECSGAAFCDDSGNATCDCVNKPPLDPGTQVAYTASAQLANGALVIAGW